MSFKPPRLVLLPPVVWEAEIYKHKSASSALGMQILQAFHTQHVGIPYAAAYDLARLVTQNDAQTSSWQSVITHLDGAWRDMIFICNKQQGGNTKHQFTNTASLRFWVHRIGLPLVAMVCSRMGQSAIWSDDDSLSVEFNYAAYCISFDAHFTQLLTEEAEDLKSFWRGRVLSLIHLTDIKATRESNHPPTSSVTGIKNATNEANHLPTSSVVETAMMLRDPVSVSKEQETNPPRIRLSRPRVTFNPKRHEAGVRGVIFSRREEDVGRMVSSEWLYEEVVRLDRLLNTGFLVYRRPPVPIQMRDALIIALCPPQIAKTPIGAFVRSVWFDFIARIAVLLARNGLSRSELRWVEALSETHIRSTTAVIGQIPDYYHLEQRTPNTDISARAILARALHWLPELSDHQARGLSVQTVEPGLSLKAWYNNAIAHQLEALYWDNTHEKSQPQRKLTPTQVMQKWGYHLHKKLDIERYSVVHVMHFIPADMDITEQEQIFDYNKVTSISRTFLPQTITGEGWGFSNSYNPTAGLVVQPLAQAAEIAEQMIACWTTSMVEALQNG